MTHHTEKVARPPKTAVSGTDVLPMVTLNGGRNGRGRSGSLRRSTMTERCAAVKAIIDPKA